MELDAEGSRLPSRYGCGEEEEINQGTSVAKTVEDCWSQQCQKADRHRHNLCHAYISQPVVVAASDSVAAIIYHG